MVGAFMQNRQVVYQRKERYMPSRDYLRLKEQKYQIGRLFNGKFFPLPEKICQPQASLEQVFAQLKLLEKPEPIVPKEIVFAYEEQPTAKEAAMRVAQEKRLIRNAPVMIQKPYYFFRESSNEGRITLQIVYRTDSGEAIDKYNIEVNWDENEGLQYFRLKDSRNQSSPRPEGE